MPIQNTIGHKRDERGIAAILITMVISAVIMLMILGFATISRREQRQSLDNQLQTQAFYAAESGVNDAKKIAALAFSSGASADKADCDNDGIYSSLKTTLSSTSDNVSYSCVLVDTSPNTVTNTAVVDGSSWVVPLGTDTAPTEFTIRWTPNPAQAGVPTGCNVGANNFTAATARTCKYPVLRVDLVDASSINSNPDYLNGRMHTYYLQPSTSGGGATSYSPSNTANATVSAALANCTNTSYGSCNITVSPGSGFSTGMAMRITSLYGQSSVTVRAGGLPIKNSQILIDSTGKAQDVLRRIQVRIPVQSSSFIPSYSAQSGTAICKRYSTAPGYFKVSDIVADVVAGGDPMCQPNLATIPVLPPTTVGVHMDQIDVGNYHVCANSDLASGGQGFCWGKNDFGQLGNGSNNNSSTPYGVTTTGVLAGKTIVGTAAGYNHTCVIDTLGRVYCWGYNSQGQLGNGTSATNNNPWPTAVVTTGPMSGKRVVKINAGDAHTCALTSDGLVYCWGGNIYGQLGTGSTTDSYVPIGVSTSGALSGKTVVDISAGYQHTCAVTSDGEAYCWGFNSHGQLGNGGLSNNSSPVRVSGGLRFSRISAGHHHTCGITTAGRAYCWGNGQQGRLGNGGMGNTNTPVAVSTGGALGTRTVTDIAAGFQHTCAVANGALFCWGLNSYGQMGNGTAGVDQLSPVAVTTTGVLAGKTISDVAAGHYNSCAVAASGEVYCWGLNDDGQLGDGARPVNSRVPVLVTVN